MKRAKWIGISLIALLIFSTVDTVAYSIYSFEKGYYFVAPFEHIVAFHSDGIGLFTLIGMVLSAVVAIVLFAI